MHIFPDSLRSEWHHGRAPSGRSPGFGPLISVELDDELGVRVTIEPVAAETFDDRDVDRTLTADEARDLAAMLWHKAEMADRRAGLR